MKKLLIDKNELIFGMDIGTRTVVGIVGMPEGERLRVIDVEVIEHESRSMMDGQVHDINEVIKTAEAVKVNLEERLGFKLHKVCIAAAGRVLRTLDIKIEKNTDPIYEINKEQVSTLEIEALIKAQNEFAYGLSEKEGVKFYCVGHTITNYYLDGYPISNLTGHRAEKIGISVIATFLPAMVVDSLYSVMNKIGLEVSSLTLEPIAAINVSIPKELRILNLALIDIGAGTSDIAITKDGSIVGYSMVPVAGDEITECIAQHYLVDFKTAEEIKLAMGNKKGNITFSNIFEKEYTITRQEVEEVIKPAIENLADAICERIIHHNQKPANAVFLIGGGSRVPGLPEAIAEKLKIPFDRVAIRGRDTIKDIIWKSDEFNGPEAITPFGIAVTGMTQRGRHFTDVKVNEKPVRLFSLKYLSVGDAISIAGFQPGQLIGKSGKSLTFTLNGVKKVIRGEYGKPAEIFLNQEPSSIDAKIKAGDEIKIVESNDGADAKVFVKDFISSTRRGSVTLNGDYKNIDDRVLINGVVVNLEREILENDKVEIVEVDTVAKLMEENFLVLTDAAIKVNSRTGSPCEKIKNGDKVEIIYRTQSGSGEAIKSIEEHIPGVVSNEYMKVTVNGEEHFLKKNNNGYFFVEVLSQINFSAVKQEGMLVMKINGSRAGFTDTVRHGDNIEIYWEK